MLNGGFLTLRIDLLGLRSSEYLVGEAKRCDLTS
jgi:hypothetical protein